MIKRLYLSLFLGAFVALAVGCGGGGGSGSDPSIIPPPAQETPDDTQNPDPNADPCAADPASLECLGDRVSIVSPAANSLWSKPEMNFVAQFAAGVSQDLALKLNGTDVSDFAVFEDDSVTIAGTAVESLLVHGENVFETRIGAEIDKVTFIYDLKNPHIVILSAVNASTGSVEQNVGDTLKVTGVVRDVAPITSVSINDIAATLNGSEFVVEVPHSAIYRIIATDSSGHSSTLEVASPQFVNDPMMALQVNQTIFRAIKPIIDDIMGGLDTAALANPEERIPFGDNQLAITRLDLTKGGEPAIDLQFLDATADALLVEAAVSLPLTGMGLEMFSATGTNPMLAMDIDIENVELTLQLAIASDELNQLKVALGSQTPFALSFGNISVNRLDVLCNDQQCISLASSASSMLNNTLFRTLLTNLINEDLVPELSAALAELEFPNRPLEAPIDLNGDGVRDTVMSVDFAPSRFDTDGQGNGLIDVIGRVYIANENLPAGFQGALGSVYVDASAVPSFAPTTDDGKEYDLGIALPANFLNQAFLSLYQSGAMSAIASELPGDALGPMGAFLGNPEQIRMRMSMGSVPYMRLSHSDLANGRTAGIRMHMDNVTIRIDSKAAGASDYSVVIGMVADISANLELGIGADNFIDLGVDNLVDMSVVSVLNEGFNVGGALPASLIESQIAPAVKDMLKTDTLPAMLKKTTEFAISMADESDVMLPLPLEMGMIMRELSVDDSDAYLVIKLDLLSSEEAQNATENVPFNISVRKRPPVAATP